MRNKKKWVDKRRQENQNVGSLRENEMKIVRIKGGERHRIMTGG